MKTLFLFLTVTSFGLFLSCESPEEEPSPQNDLAIDLQNGFWETHFTSGAIMVLKFNISSYTSYWIEGTPSCIIDSGSKGYSLTGNMLTLGDDPSSATVEIQCNTLTLTWVNDGFDGIFERKSALDYPECK